MLLIQPELITLPEENQRKKKTKFLRYINACGYPNFIKISPEKSECSWTNTLRELSGFTRARGQRAGL